jgi:hypothetical protein
LAGALAAKKKYFRGLSAQSCGSHRIVSSHRRHERELRRAKVRDHRSTRRKRSALSRRLLQRVRAISVAHDAVQRHCQDIIVRALRDAFAARGARAWSLRSECERSRAQRAHVRCALARNFNRNSNLRKSDRYCTTRENTALATPLPPRAAGSTRRF